MKVLLYGSVPVAIPVRSAARRAFRVTDFMTLLKNMAVREGHAPSGIKAQMDLTKGQGRIYPLDDFDNKKRKKAGTAPVAHFLQCDQGNCFRIRHEETKKVDSAMRFAPLGIV